MIKAKSFLFLFLMPTFFLFSINASSASNLKNDYLIKRDYYFKQHQEYIAARQTYLNYRTLQTKEKLTKSLREFLISRNEFLRGYLLVLLAEGEQFLSESDFGEVRSWINWLDQETKQIKSVESLEELLVFANHLRERYSQIEKSVFIFLTKLTIGQQNNLINEIERLVAEIRNNNKSNRSSELILHWLNEITERLISITEKQQLALEVLEKERVKEIGVVKTSWQKSKKLLVEANSQLGEAISFLDEIITALGQ